MARFLYIAVAVLGSTAPLRAQHADFERLGAEHGLPDDRVWRIHQDRQGFMWFGTPAGLCRYDGRETLIFQHDPSDSSSLGANSVQFVKEDSSGTIWVGTDGGGLNRFDQGRMEFRRYTHDPDDLGSLADDAVLSLFEDSRGSIWLGTAGGVSVLDPRSAEFRSFRHDPRDPGSPGVGPTWNIREDRSGGVWCTSWGGLTRFDLESGEVQRFRHDPADPGSLSHDRTWNVAVADDGTVWIATDRGLDRFVPESASFVHYRHDPDDAAGLNDDPAYCLLEDSSGYLWIGTATGLDRLDPASGRIERYELEEPPPSRWAGTGVQALLESGDGSIWVARQGGLHRLGPGAERFVAHRHDPTDPRSLSDDRVRGLYEDRRGLVWVGTFGGLNKVLTSDTPFRFLDPTAGAATAPGEREVLSVYEEEDGRLWLGTAAGVLHELGPGGLIASHRTERRDPLGANPINAIRAAEDGTLLLAANAGLLRFDPATGAFELLGDSTPRVSTLHRDSLGNVWLGTELGLMRFDPKSGTIHPAADVGHVRVILESRSGLLWLGCRDSLNAFDPRTGAIERFEPDPSDPRSLGGALVSALHEDRDGDLWVATSASLDRLDRETGEFDHFGTADGLPHATVRAILEAGDGRMWLFTQDGLARLDPRSMSLTHYGRADGLSFTRFNSAATHRGPTGTFHAGGLEGLTSFRPAEVRDLPPPPIVLTALLLERRLVRPGDGTLLPRSITATDELTLAYSDRIVTLKFAALAYRAPSESRYRYRLSGLEDDWVDVDPGQRSATFTNLLPGSYDFQVIGSDHRGTWNHEGASLRIVVTPPWWETAWFRSLASAAVLGLALAGYRVRTRSIRRNNVTLKGEIAAREVAERDLKALSRRMVSAQEEDRARIARELHDDVNQRLAALSIDMAMTKRELEHGSPGAERVAAAAEQIQRISADVRKVSHELHPAMLHHLGLSAAVQTLCDDLGARSKLSPRLDLEGEIDGIPEETSLCLYRIAQEALGNVAQHAAASEVRLALTATGDEVRLAVHDDGRGFEPGRSFTGLGLASMEERARLLGGSVTVRSRPGAGTEVRAALPLDRTR